MAVALKNARGLNACIWFWLGLFIFIPVWGWGGTELLQFKVKGFDIGFHDGGYYFLGSDYCLKVEFVSSNRVRPVPINSAEKDRGGEENTLETVVYSQVWNGVDLELQSVLLQRLKSTFRIEGGKLPWVISRIRLRTNADLCLDGRGNLIVALHGLVIRKSAPTAWQLVDGKKRVVEIGYRIYGKRDLGFFARNTRNDLPLIIEAWQSWPGTEQNKTDPKPVSIRSVVRVNGGVT